VISSFFFLKQLISYAIVPRWRATRKRMYGVDRADFSGKPAYQSLANDHIEPPIRIRYQPVTVEGERVGVF
jgi:hypothetical protein